MFGGFGSGYLNQKSGQSLNGNNKMGITRAAAIGGVQKSTQKSWRPLRHEGRLGAAGLSSDNKWINNRVTPNDLGNGQHRAPRPFQAKSSYNSITNFHTTKNSRDPIM